MTYNVFGGTLNLALSIYAYDYSRSFCCRNYVIEKQNVAHMQWQRASGCVPSDVTQFKVSRLDEGQTYLFQVSAENDQGCGPALTTQFETLAKNPFGKLLLSSFICQEHIQHNVQEEQIAYGRCDKAEVQH